MQTKSNVKYQKSNIKRLKSNIQYQKSNINMNIFNIIVAVAQDGAIGCRGDLLWHIHDDMIFFKNTTKGHPVVMGRKTWESLQVKPLPKRENIVITSDKNFAFNGVTVLNDTKQVMALPDYNTDVFIIGGGTVYKEFLPMCQKLYITKVFRNFPDADTFFPEINPEEWKQESKSEVFSDKESGLEYQFVTLSRV